MRGGGGAVSFKGEERIGGWGELGPVESSSVRLLTSVATSRGNIHIENSQGRSEVLNGKLVGPHS